MIPSQRKILCEFSALFRGRHKFFEVKTQEGHIYWGKGLPGRAAL